MAEVVVELLAAEGWRRVGGACDVEPPGSISTENVGQRHVWLFGFVDGEPGLWRSEFGVDLETPAWRLIETTNLVCISGLSEPYEMEHGPVEHRVKIRFRLVEQ